MCADAYALSGMPSAGWLAGRISSIEVVGAYHLAMGKALSLDTRLCRERDTLTEYREALLAHGREIPVYRRYRREMAARRTCPPIAQW